MPYPFIRFYPFGYARSVPVRGHRIGEGHCWVYRCCTAQRTICLWAFCVMCPCMTQGRHRCWDPGHNVPPFSQWLTTLGSWWAVVGANFGHGRAAIYWTTATVATVSPVDTDRLYHCNLCSKSTCEALYLWSMLLVNRWLKKLQNGSEDTALYVRDRIFE